MSTFHTEQEILDATDEKGWIKGLVEVSFADIICTEGLNETNEFLTNELVGEDYGYLLMDLAYRIVACNVGKQTITIEVEANAEELLDEMESDDNN